MRAARNVSALRRMWSASAQVLSYSAEFGSAAVPDTAEEVAQTYEREHRVRQGSLGLHAEVSCLQAAAGVAIGAAVPPQAEAIATIATQEAPARREAPVFFASSGDVDQLTVPTVRFEAGTLVLAVGHNEHGPVISPGKVEEESVDENSFTTTTANLGPGSFIVKMEDPDRLCGVVLQDGTIMSVKDPWFIVNWVSHVLPKLVDEETKRFPPVLMQYINDVKRVIVKNQDAIPSMEICQRVFVKNSIEDFKYFTL